jgi:chemotaxis protein CheX
MTAAKNDRLIQLGINYITLPNLSAKDGLRVLEVEAKQWFISNLNIFVFDFTNNMYLEQNIITQLLQAFAQFKKAEKKIYSLNINSSLQKELQKRGILQSLNLYSSLEEIESSLVPKTKTNSTFKLNADVLKEFVSAATKAFEVQVNIKINLGKFFSKKHLFEKDDAVVGTIDVDITGFKGSVSICFSKPVFIGVYKALLDEDIADINDESKDAAGELLNIIYGQAKTALNQTMGLQLQPARPKVQLNPELVFLTEPVIVIPFTSSIGSFRIEIHVQ